MKLSYLALIGAATLTLSACGSDSAPNKKTDGGSDAAIDLMAPGTDVPVDLAQPQTDTPLPGLDTTC